MNQQEIKETMKEAYCALMHGRIDKIFQLDDYTFVIHLFRSGKKYSLLVSVLKRSKRFHLLFKEIHKEYLLSSHAANVLKRYLLKTRVERLLLHENCIEIRTGYNQDYRLLIDFSECNITIFNKMDTPVFSLSRKNPLGHEKSLNVQPPCKNNDCIPKIFPVNNGFSSEFFKERKEDLTKNLDRILKTEEKKVIRLAGKLNAEKKEVDNKDFYKNMGELLKYNLAGLPRGVKTTTMIDFNGNEVKAAVDPGLTPGENMNAYFNKYKKLKKQVEVIDIKIRNQEKRLELIREIKNDIITGGAIGLNHPPSFFLNKYDLSPLGAVFSGKVENFHRPPEKKGTGTKTQKRTYLEFLSRSGKKILVGRNAGENEELSKRIARGNDLWFHVESGSGSHVILRYEKRGSFLPEDVEDAAVLALYFSKSRSRKKGDVVYTYCKYLKKPKNSKIGTVLYFSNKTRFTTLEDKVLAGLMNHHPQIT
jgi:predicted ribosome quality control (RQC) complex YloA/Tae2 family protein